LGGGGHEEVAGCLPYWFHWLYALNSVVGVPNEALSPEDEGSTRLLPFVLKLERAGARFWNDWNVSAAIGYRDGGRGPLTTGEAGGKEKLEDIVDTAD
jgi:hypothetical protein